MNTDMQQPELKTLTALIHYLEEQHDRACEEAEHNQDLSYRIQAAREAEWIQSVIDLAYELVYHPEHDDDPELEVMEARWHAREAAAQQDD